MKLNSFSLNMVLSFIVVAGAIVYCRDCKTDSISKEELKRYYISKKTVKFQDLPKSERKKYIHKKSISYMDESFMELNEKNIDENSTNSIQRLRKIIKNLKSKISIVQDDNIQLSNDKEDMQKIVKKMKMEFKKSRDRLLKQNMQQINETEEQHYKNISELTAKINDLQRENLRLSEDNNMEIIALKAKINILNDKLSKIKGKKVSKE